MLKFSENIQLSFKINKEEEQIAQESEKMFLSCLNVLSNFKDHLAIIKDSFSQEEAISVDLLYKKRGLLSRYRQQVKDNFEKKVRPIAAKASKLFSFFDSDANIEELNSSFEDGIKQIEKLTVKFLDAMDNIKDPEFIDTISIFVEDIFKEIETVDQLVRDRIVEFIDDHILSKHDFKSDHSLKFDNLAKPLQEMLEERKILMPQISKRPQSMNPSDNQKAWTPTDIRDIPEHEDVGRYNN